MKYAHLAFAALALLVTACAAPDSSRQSLRVVSKPTTPKVSGSTSAASEPRAPKVSEREAFIQRIGSMTDKELWDFGSERRDAMTENMRLTGKLELPKWDDLYTAEATKREAALMLTTQELAALSKPDQEERLLATEGVPFAARLRKQLESAHGSSLDAIKGTRALERYRASEGCDGQDSREVLAMIAELEETVSRFHTVKSFPEYERQARDMHTNLSFAFADEALRRGCLDDADSVYRSLVAFYTGGAYAGIRDRAKLGIDDVRAARTAGQ
jgi:hypothetical protein